MMLSWRQTLARESDGIASGALPCPSYNQIMGVSIQNVAVIGAGVSGVVSALHLEDAGLKVTVYERSSSAGGIWCVHSCIVSLVRRVI